MYGIEREIRRAIWLYIENIPLIIVRYKCTARHESVRPFAFFSANIHTTAINL